ncbi:unnamed protein product [Adineta steineri]|uniref:Uncharacterized protein n=2 Tax=Adineta steineri TaxID=433720 RepID=A0A814V3E2_9BILA|nr:unnamed protein product [Adineta steineri]
MSKLPHLPEKYNIVWLDAHIGQLDFCVQLKRAFFTHVDPESGQEVSPTNQDIDQFILSQSDFSATFDSFHFSLRTFTNVEACLNYIDEIQNHRIIFITSSILGEPAVEQLIKRYVHSFTNTRTNEPYNSIYIFCADISRAVQWARSYRNYIQIFDIETDLLARLTRDLADEFFEHAEERLEANDDIAAIERLSWSKSLFIRYDKLICLSEPENQKLKPSKILKEINEMLDIAEKRVRQQQENTSDEVSKAMQMVSKDALVLGSAYPPQLFEDEPTLIIFDHDGYLVDPPVDLKPFTRIANIINNQTTFTQRLNYPNRSFIIAIILPQLNQHHVLPFVQQNVLGYPSVQLFYLFFADSNGNNLAANCGPKLIECHSITSRTSAQTRVVCARANDLNIAYCESHRVQYEHQGDNSVANLFAEQKLDRVSLQLKYNQQLRREFEQRLFE